MAGCQAGLAPAGSGPRAVRIDHVVLRLDLLVGGAELNRAPVRSDDALLRRGNPIQGILDLLKDKADTQVVDAVGMAEKLGSPRAMNARNAREIRPR